MGRYFIRSSVSLNNDPIRYPTRKDYTTIDGFNVFNFKIFVFFDVTSLRDFERQKLNFSSGSRIGRIYITKTANNSRCFQTLEKSRFSGNSCSKSLLFHFRYPIDARTDSNRSHFYNYIFSTFSEQLFKQQYIQNFSRQVLRKPFENFSG